MSGINAKKAVNIKFDNDVHRLTRKPLYPEINAEKENMELFSSNDVLGEYLQDHYSKVPSRNNSPSKADSVQLIPKSPKHKNKRGQQKQMNNFQDSENSETDMERDNLLNERIDQDLEISPDLSSKSDRCKNSQNARLNQPAMQLQGIEPLASTSNFSLLLSKNSLYLVLPCIICILISVCWLRYSSTPYTNSQFNASALVNSLKAEFKNQPLLTFHIINHAMMKVLEVQPTAPAIILLLATNGSERVCSEFAHKLVHLLSVPNYTINIFGKNCKQANTNHVKMDIDKTILNKLESDQLGSVLIHDLDQIPGQAAMIFHKYFDHEYAPFKKAVFVMTVNYKKAIGNYSDVKVWDKAANDHLLSVWTDIGVDQVTPLLARLTVSVVVIKA